jgi:hypothetical protein
MVLLGAVYLSAVSPGKVKADVNKLDNPASPIKSRTANKMDDICVFILFAFSKIQLSEISYLYLLSYTAEPNF